MSSLYLTNADLFKMLNKLSYLESLKNNIGEEMAEMMSEEITKVMDE